LVGLAFGQLHAPGFANAMNTGSAKKRAHSDARLATVLVTWVPVSSADAGVRGQTLRRLLGMGALRAVAQETEPSRTVDEALDGRA
jgi:hypothetical protein